MLLKRLSAEIEKGEPMIAPLASDVIVQDRVQDEEFWHYCNRVMSNDSFRFRARWNVYAGNYSIILQARRRWRWHDIGRVVDQEIRIYPEVDGDERKEVMDWLSFAIAPYDEQTRNWRLPIKIVVLHRLR